MLRSAISRESNPRAAIELNDALTLFFTKVLVGRSDNAYLQQYLLHVSSALRISLPLQLPEGAIQEIAQERLGGGELHE